MPRSVNLDDVVMVAKKLAMKILAFNNRGENDFMGSHDLEAVLSIVDGRATLADEVAQADPSIRKYVCGEFAHFLADTRFRESLSGHLPPDAASQQRLPGLEQKIHTLAALPHA